MSHAAPEADPDDTNNPSPGGTRRRPRSKITSSFVRISSSLPLFVEKFDWKWVFVGVLFIVAGNAAAYLALRGVFAKMIAGDQVMSAALAMAGVALLTYFLGGLLVGRMSKGRTVKEPAVAAVLAVLVIFVVQFFMGMVNIIGLIVGAPFCFGVAYLGGLVGEKWQGLGKKPAD
jgi:hypothetical protein